MFKTIDEYLEALKTEMQGSDPALLQDALSDAREHLSAALSDARARNAEINEADALPAIVDNYGSPEETASAYREVEKRTSPVIKQNTKPRSLLGRFFGVYADPRTWGAMLFMFIAFITGLIYFTWAVTGASLSLGLMILIIGVPFAILFLFSVQGLALLEGRIVEALLGVRMPRRPAFALPGLKWGERLKALLTDWHTWRALIYLLLQLPLGLIYFTINICLLAFELSLMAVPIAQYYFKNAGITAGITLNGHTTTLPLWSLIALQIGGFLLLSLNMHLARGIGWLHGRYAKWLLVS